MKKRRYHLTAAFLAVVTAGIAMSGLSGCSRMGNQYETVALEKEKPFAAEAAEQSETVPESEAVLVLEPELKSEAEETGAKDPQPEEPFTLLFAGDIYLSQHVLNAYDRAGGIEGVLDERLRTEIEAADLFFANQEFPFSDRGTPAADKQFTFRLPPAWVSLMQEIGVDLVTLANNHALDYGTEALLDTCSVLEEAGIPYIGAGENLEAAKRAEFVEWNGKTYGFLAASRVFPVADWAAGGTHPGMLSAYDPDALCEVIRETKRQCDYLVLYVHWGIERNTIPETYQRTQGYKYIDAGADLVVGSHPHVLQGIEYYNGKPILYSLGNFIFGSSIPETMLVKAEISPDGDTELSVIPATSASGYTRELEAEKRDAFYEKLTGLSTGILITEDGSVEAEEVSSEASEISEPSEASM